MGVELWRTVHAGLYGEEGSNTDEYYPPDHLYVVGDRARDLQFGIVRETAAVVQSAWATEAFRIVPFLQVGEEIVAGATDPARFYFTPERVAIDATGQENGRQSGQEVEISLVARGVAGLGEPLPGSPTNGRVPWELQVGYTYDARLGTLAVFVRPQVHGRTACHPEGNPGGERCVRTLFGLRVDWSESWQRRARRAVYSPLGAMVGVPEQPGVSVAVTDRSVTALGEYPQGEGLLIVLHFSFPGRRDRRGEFRSPLEAIIDGLRLSFRLGSIVPAEGRTVHNGLPVITDWTQATGWIHLEPPGSYGNLPAGEGGRDGLPEEITVHRWVEPAPSFPRLPAGGDVRVVCPPAPPGRYRLVCEIKGKSGWLRLAFPFRYWPQALRQPAAAQFAQLLLTSCLEADFVVAYNFVHPRRIYVGTERDDVLAEAGRLAMLLFRELGDEDLRALAWAMAEQLLAHQQPDGGFTFGVSANGFRADYSDTDADAVQFLLMLAGDEELDPLRRQVYRQAAERAAHFICTYQDPEGFFWGRVDRPGKRSYGQQPWFTSYAVVACLEVAQGSAAGVANGLISAARRGLEWLCSVQAEDGHFRFDTEGPYADYDDLSNTSVAVWALCRALRLLPRAAGGNMEQDTERERWWQAAQRGMKYLLGLESAKHPGQFTGRQTRGVEKLVYDYRLGSAFQSYLEASREWQRGVKPETEPEPAAALYRYLNHLRSIQGRGTLTGGWGSVFRVDRQEYAAKHEWFETGSAWQEYVFLGWQGKLIELMLGVDGRLPPVTLPGAASPSTVNGIQRD